MCRLFEILLSVKVSSNGICPIFWVVDRNCRVRNVLFPFIYIHRRVSYTSKNLVIIVGIVTTNNSAFHHS